MGSILNDDDNMTAASTAAAAAAAPLSTMAAAMFFGSVVCCTVALWFQSVIVHGGDRRAYNTSCNSTKSQPLDVNSFMSIYTLLHHFSIFGLILFYAYLCEYHPPFCHSEKSYNRDEFFFLTALLFVASAFTLKRHTTKQPSSKSKDNGPTTMMTTTTEQQQSTAIIKSPQDNNNNNNDPQPNNNNNELLTDDVLNRHQTEEWKGWMQFMFLLYHYYHAEEVYNSIRVMITCYVWMTGFGNFSFFYLKGDYSLIRVLQMLWRLNFLVLFLCLTQGTTYILYYICLLHTFYFGLVYLTMRIMAKRLNYSTWGLRCKLLVVALLIYLIWDVDNGLFGVLHKPFLGNTPIVGAAASYGALWEWYFRSSLDNWSSFLGMVFALNYPITNLWYRQVETKLTIWQQIAVKTSVGLVLIAALYWWTTFLQLPNKWEYNQTNAYLAPVIPLLTYIYFRNLTPWLRSHSLELLHQIGKTTLETYLMQHHIWLTSNAKTLLTLIPGYPKLNFLLVSMIYIVLSRRLYQLTLFLRGMILPSHHHSTTTICVIQLGALIGIVLGFVALAWLFQVMGILNLMTVGWVALTCGLGLYKLIMNRTWQAFQDSSTTTTTAAAAMQQQQQSTLVMNGSCAVKKSSPHAAAASSSLAPLYAGAVAVLMVGLIWQHAAAAAGGASSSSKIFLPLPATCAPFANDGVWVAVDGCNEDNRGIAYQQDHVATLGTCSSSLSVWGWKANSSHCRFVQRTPKTMIQHHVNLTFVGDSVVRHIYHAACREWFGDANAGAYNTSMEKHADMERTYNKSRLKFQWAPYAQDLVQAVNALLLQSQLQQPDVLVIGGGPWDRLHRYNNATAQATTKAQFEQLSQQLQKLQNIPVVWVIPTVINDWGLLTDQKRQELREEQLQELRDYQDEIGLTSSSGAATFVLDGRSFTRQRVAESYDGVHYPLAVYDAGAQILAQALDWLVPSPTPPNPSPPPLGSMAQPLYGLAMLMFCALGMILGFDGFGGVLYVASWITTKHNPNQLQLQAFTCLHERNKLPPYNNNGATASATMAIAMVTTTAAMKSKVSDRSLQQQNNETRQHVDDDEELLQSLVSISGGGGGSPRE